MQEKLIPQQLFIDPTGACMNNCRRCITKNLCPLDVSSLSLSLEEIVSILDDAKELGICRIQLTGGGDPLAHPNLKEILKESRVRQIAYGVTSSLNTNINEELLELLSGSSRISQRVGGASGICVSIWASNKENYAYMHGTSPEYFDRVKRNIRALSERGAHISVTYVIMPENVRDVYNTIKLVEVLGCKNIWFIKAYTPLKDKLLSRAEMQEVEDQLDKAQEDFPEFFIDRHALELTYSRKQGQRNCSYTLYRAHIDADGYVYPCWIHKYHPEHSYGNIREKRLKDILFSRERIDFLRSFVCDTYFCKFQRGRRGFADLLSRGGDKQ